MKHIQYTMDNLKGDLLEITRQIAAVSFKPSCILGIARGGIIPATLLSQYYNVSCFTYHYSLRDHVGAMGDEVLSHVAKGNVLVVDDICDGGHTLAYVAKELSQRGGYPRFAVLHNNVGQTVFPHVDFAANEINKVDNDIWIDYPWEQWWR